MTSPNVYYMTMAIILGISMIVLLVFLRHFIMRAGGKFLQEQEAVMRAALPDFSFFTFYKKPYASGIVNDRRVVVELTSAQALNPSTMSAVSSPSVMYIVRIKLQHTDSRALYLVQQSAEETKTGYTLTGWDNPAEGVFLNHIAPANREASVNDFARLSTTTKEALRSAANSLGGVTISPDWPSRYIGKENTQTLYGNDVEQLKNLDLMFKTADINRIEKIVHELDPLLRALENDL